MKNFLVALLLVALVGGGYWWWQNKNTIPETVPVDTASDSRLPEGAVMEDGMMPDETTGVNTSSAAPMSATVTYNGTSYSPSEVTVKKGGTVHWISSSSNEGMWVASAQHPSHTVYSGTTRQEHCPDTSGTAFDQCASGSSFSFTFDKVGTWGFHDHLNASAWGKVIVVE